MRKQFCEAMLKQAENKDTVFLTGDLGFMALEPLQTVMGERFINAGIAEQNMISVAAAMAKEGFNAWAYSIAPFCYARPFEQIRNDVCFHNLSVKIVGNGGGYGYGVMGATHHAIEDYGILLTLPGMRVFVPVFNEDVEFAVSRIAGSKTPGYLRLGAGEAPVGYVIPEYAPWRQVTRGGGRVIAAVGPIGGSLIDAALAMDKRIRPNLWVISELPIDTTPPPPEFLHQISRGLVVVEEHVARGGFGSELALWLAIRGIHAGDFIHLSARKHIYHASGSQKWLREESGLSPDLVMGIAGKPHTLEGENRE